MVACLAMSSEDGVTAANGVEHLTLFPALLRADLQRDLGNTGSSLVRNDLDLPCGQCLEAKLGAGEGNVGHRCSRPAAFIRIGALVRHTCLGLVTAVRWMLAGRWAQLCS